MIGKLINDKENSTKPINDSYNPSLTVPIIERDKEYEDNEVNHYSSMKDNTDTSVHILNLKSYLMNKTKARASNDNKRLVPKGTASSRDISYNVEQNTIRTNNQGMKKQLSATINTLSHRSGNTSRKAEDRKSISVLYSFSPENSNKIKENQRKIQTQKNKTFGKVNTTDKISIRQSTNTSPVKSINKSINIQTSSPMMQQLGLVSLGRSTNVDSVKNQNKSTSWISDKKNQNSFIESDTSQSVQKIKDNYIALVNIREDVANSIKQKQEELNRLTYSVHSYTNELAAIKCKNYELDKVNRLNAVNSAKTFELNQLLQTHKVIYNQEEGRIRAFLNENEGKIEQIDANTEELKREIEKEKEAIKLIKYDSENYNKEIESLSSQKKKAALFINRLDKRINEIKFDMNKRVRINM